MTPKMAADQLTAREQQALREIRHWCGGPDRLVESIVIGARPACKRLEALGLIVVEEVRGPKGAPSWIYRLPEGGR